MINIILIAIFTLPWLIIPFDKIPEPTRLIKSSFFDMAMFAIIVFALIKGLKFEYKNKYVGWLAAWVFITIGFNWYFPLCRGFGYNAGTIEASIHFLLAVVATICVCSTFERSDFVRISKAIAYSTMLVCSFAFLQIVGLDPMKSMAHYTYKEVRHVCALLDHPDLLANYIAIAIPFFLYLKGTRYILGLILALFVMFFCKSSLSYLAAFISFNVFMVLRYRDSKKILITLASVFVLFVMTCIAIPSLNKFHDGFTGRVNAWKVFVDRMDNPVFGQGLGIAKSLNVHFTKVDLWYFAHNDYLEIYLSLGVLGLFLFSLIVINAIKKFNYKKDNYLGFAYMGSFIAFLIVMFASFPMEIAPLALGGLISFWGVSKKTSVFLYDHRNKITKRTTGSNV